MQENIINPTIIDAETYEEEKSLLGKELLVEQHESLLGDMNDTSSETSPLESLINNDTSSDTNMQVDQAAAEFERRRKYFMDPNVQAEIVYTNFIRNQKQPFSGKELRRLRREFLKNAKKGRYMHIFKEEIYGVSPEVQQKRFEKLNG